MTTLYALLVIASVIVGLESAQHIENYVNTINLGNINPVTNKKVLNAFVRLNTNLPPELRDTTQASGGIYLDVMYPDKRHAIIHVYSHITEYYGFVEVFFNGGRQQKTPDSPTYGHTGKLNLSLLTDLNRNLELRRSGVSVANDDQGHKNIVEAFMSKNPRLPTELKGKLRVKNVKRTSATLYVYPSADYEGDVYVTF